MELPHLCGGTIHCECILKPRSQKSESGPDLPAQPDYHEIPRSVLVFQRCKIPYDCFLVRTIQASMNSQSKAQAELKYTFAECNGKPIPDGAGYWEVECSSQFEPVVVKSVKETEVILYLQM